jgi:hypothetical protein
MEMLCSRNINVRRTNVGVLVVAVPLFHDITKDKEQNVRFDKKKELSQSGKKE